MADQNIEKILEALLFSSDRPLPVDRLKVAMAGVEGVDVDLIKNALNNLKDYYNSQDRSFELVEIAGGYQIATKPDYNIWISKLYKKSQDKLRGPSMETLAIIVYKQPITKGEIEAIRGVDSDGVVKTLLEKNLVKIKGRKEVPGRPILYGTTDEFLMRFGLKDLKSLPSLREFTEQDLDYSKIQERLNADMNSAKKGENYEPEKTEA